MRSLRRWEMLLQLLGAKGGQSSFFFPSDLIFGFPGLHAKWGGRGICQASCQDLRGFLFALLRGEVHPHRRNAPSIHLYSLLVHVIVLPQPGFCCSTTMTGSSQCLSFDDVKPMASSSLASKFIARALSPAAQSRNSSCSTHGCCRCDAAVGGSSVLVPS